ncbi:protein STRUBBELIG-RECEPTOR FAMILY 2-like [Magnolia sinica]|uniref:protein STRUBBELIG-RECEPTOR FAMILY 2-like n=1 Tax=Magnolia sinica TaxID=86752 RepID=UPI00265936B4|nr:protein STRUBBELIG-RECEPTOR FAMILY 2-like [Magnolia sinica]
MIVGSDQAMGRYAQGSKNLATSSSCVHRDLNESWTKLDDDADVTVDLSEENLGESARNYGHSTESQSRKNRLFQNTHTHGTNSDSTHGGSATTKQMRPARPYDNLGMSFTTVSEAITEIFSKHSVPQLFAEMAKLLLMRCLLAFLYSALLFSATSATTDPLDASLTISEERIPRQSRTHQLIPSLSFAVTALQDLYSALNFPPQLTRWKSIGGDPCGEDWKGISCSGTSVQSIKIDGLGINGTLGLQLSSLLSLKYFDAGFNSIHSEIPFNLPPNATHINLAFNQISQNIPSSLASMKYLCSLNLSHNSLSGPIGNIFTDLLNLKQLDLSYNNFSGDLPVSFSNLTNLNILHLQNNQFTGSVIFLDKLPLSELNIQNNHFSSVIPKHFETIPILSIEGNVFVTGVVHSPSPYNPHHNKSIGLSESNAPATKSSALKIYTFLTADIHNHKWLGPGTITYIVGAAVFVVSCVAALVSIHIRISHKRKLKRLKIIHRTSHHLPISTPIRVPRDSPGQWSVSMDILRPIPSVRNCRTDGLSRIRSLSKRRRALMTAKLYTVADLQAATNCFAEDNLLGEGSLGSVYKATFPDGEIFAVKKINMMPLSLHEEVEFLELVRNMSLLRHPNISSLFGYCMEHQQYFLVYEFAGNVSLEDILHFARDDGRYLSWNARVWIALDVARALEYLHLLSPSIAHGNIKAANVLLNDELTPRICDCGLAVLRPLTYIKVKASELPSTGGTGYKAPEYGMPGIDNTKSDVYGFGVLLLELLTGLKPFDSSRARKKQSLIKWASTRLHNFSSLQEMVDPAIRDSHSALALSQYAEAITLCTQVEPELRPPISEIAELLASLIQRTIRTGQSWADMVEVDSTGTPFRTPSSQFES